MVREWRTSLLATEMALYQQELCFGIAVILYTMQVFHLLDQLFTNTVLVGQIWPDNVFQMAHNAIFHNSFSVLCLVFFCAAITTLA